MLVERGYAHSDANGGLSRISAVDDDEFSLLANSQIYRVAEAAAGHLVDPDRVGEAEPTRDTNCHNDRLLLYEGKLLEGAVHDGLRVNLQPMLQERGVRTSEVHVVLEIPNGEILFLQ